MRWGAKVCFRAGAVLRFLRNEHFTGEQQGGMLLPDHGQASRRGPRVAGRIEYLRRKQRVAVATSRNEPLPEYPT